MLTLNSNMKVSEDLHIYCFGSQFRRDWAERNETSVRTISKCYVIQENTEIGYLLEEIRESSFLLFIVLRWKK